MREADTDVIIIGAMIISSLLLYWRIRQWVIRVNAIAPSVTQTRLAERILHSEHMAESIKKLHPLKRLGTREDIAQLAAFLISEEAGGIKGQVIGVDGGRSTIETMG